MFWDIQNVSGNGTSPGPLRYHGEHFGAPLSRQLREDDAVLWLRSAFFALLGPGTALAWGPLWILSSTQTRFDSELGGGWACFPWWRAFSRSSGASGSLPMRAGARWPRSTNRGSSSEEVSIVGCEIPCTYQ